MSPCVDSFPNTCGSKSVSPLNYCLAGYFLCLDIFGTKTQLTSCIFLRRVETSKRRKLGPLVSGKIGASGWFGVWVLPLMHQFWIARPPVVSDGYLRAARVRDMEDPLAAEEVPPGFHHEHPLIRCCRVVLRRKFWLLQLDHLHLLSSIYI